MSWLSIRFGNYFRRLPVDKKKIIEYMYRLRRIIKEIYKRRVDMLESNNNEYDPQKAKWVIKTVESEPKRTHLNILHVPLAMCVVVFMMTRYF